MKYISILLISLLSTAAFAQKSSWGIKGGLNYNLSKMGLENAYNSTGDIFEGEVANNGWHLGLVSRSHLSELFFVQFEGLYTTSSHTISGKTSSNVNISNEFENKAAQFDILGGLEFVKFLRIQGGLTGRLELDEEYQATFGTFNVGYALGAGVNLGRFNFDLTYNSSFDAHHGEWKGIPLSHDQSEILISVGFMF